MQSPPRVSRRSAPGRGAAPRPGAPGKPWQPRPWRASTGTLFGVIAPPDEPVDGDDDGYVEEMTRYLLLRRATMHVALFLLREIDNQHRVGEHTRFSPDVERLLLSKCEMLGSVFDVGDNRVKINRQLTRALKTFGLITYDTRPGSRTPNWPMVNRPPGFTTATLDGLLDRAFRGQWPDLDLPFRDYTVDEDDGDGDGDGDRDGDDDRDRDDETR